MLMDANYINQLFYSLLQLVGGNVLGLKKFHNGEPVKWNDVHHNLGLIMAALKKQIKDEIKKEMEDNSLNVKISVEEKK